MKRIVTLVVAMLLAISMISMLAFADEAAAPDTAQEAVVETEAVDAEEPGASSEGAQSIEVPLSEEGEVLVDDYSNIEIPSNQVKVEDYEIESYISSILNYASTTEQIKEGTVEEGDLVNFDFSGFIWTVTKNLSKEVPHRDMN